MHQGLDQVKAAIIDSLENAGVAAKAAFEPEWAKEYGSPVVAVGFRSGESRSDALSCYLGQQLDDETQVCREVYGMRLDLTLSLDIYAPASEGAAGCERALETLHQVMLSGLPSGLKPESLQWEAIGWDEATGMFLRKGNLACHAHFIAKTAEDGELLSDFILKGRVTK